MPADRTARLVQANIPILQGGDWTKEYFDDTLRDLSLFSLTRPGKDQNNFGAASDSSSTAAATPDLIVWPESPAPFYTTDPAFRDSVSNIARQAQTWMLVGSLGIRNAGETPLHATRLYNSGSLVTPGGEWVGRYDKIHLVPFGEYVPFKRVFGFAGGLTKEVGDFSSGASRAPLQTRRTASWVSSSATSRFFRMKSGSWRLTGRRFW